MIRVPAACLFLVVYVAALPAFVRADDFKPQIDQTIRSLIEEKKTLGVAVGILTQNEPAKAFGYGKVAQKSDKEPDGDTIFEIGSITKVFTALLLSDMAAEGLVKLDDPVRLYLPDNVKVPTRGGKEITLLDLATHRSGLPRLPTNFVYSQMRSASNPYAHYTPQLMFAFLSGYELPRGIGSKYEYSNFGFGLLGYALARKANRSYEELVVKRICEPLKMKDTRITLSPELRARLAEGHTTGGKVAANWDFDTLAGCGALRSSVSDLLIFAAANLGRIKTPLLSAMETCHAERGDSDVKTVRMGLGWHSLHPQGTEQKVIWHNGGTGGYHSYLGFIKESQTAVVVLSNSTTSIDAQALRILKAITPARK